MTEEEFFISNYPDSCYGDKPLSPYWDLFQDGVEFGERESKKQIAELTEQNTSFLTSVENLNKSVQDLEKVNAELKRDFIICEKNADTYYDRLTKAKEIIKSLLDCLRQDTNDPQTNYYVGLYMTEAEQFLKDSEVEK